MGAGQEDDGRTVMSSDASVWFLIIFSTSLMLARALTEARLTLENRVSNSDLEATKRRFSIISYPKWLAACIYAAILAPATYCAVGALLYLSLDQSQQDLASVTETLNKAEAAAMTTAPPLDVDTSALVKTLNKQVTLTTEAAPIKVQLLNAVNAGRRMDRDFQTWRSDYKFRALEQASRAKGNLTTSQFSDYVSRLAGNFSTSIVQARLEVRSCLQTLGDIRSVIPTDGTDPSPALVAVSNMAQDAAKVCPETTSTALRTPPAAMGSPVSHASAGAINTASASAPQVDDCNCEQYDAPFYREAYRWLADAPQAAIRIVGLIGFGLFGAAIRMMGRPDEVPYSYADLDAAQKDLDSAREEYEKASFDAEAARKAIAASGARKTEAQQVFDTLTANIQDTTQTLQSAQAENSGEVATIQKQLKTLTADQTNRQDAAKAAADAFEKDEKALREVEVRLEETRRKAQAAASIFEMRRRALLEDRNSIVVERPVADRRTPHGHTVEYTVSGAPARVFVQGLGAAFTVFLAGESGVKLLTDDGNTSAVGLLLACFVGAVFAQEIWRAANQVLVRRTSAETQPAAPAT